MSEGKKKGGKRPGAGRPPKSKDGYPRNVEKAKGKGKSKEVVVVDENLTKETTSIIEESILKHLTGDVRTLYKQYSREYSTPSDALKEIAKMMHVRHHTALMTELKEYEVKVRNAKRELNVIKKTGKVGGRTVTAEAKQKRMDTLNQTIHNKLHLSTQLTTLESELIKLYSEIEKIESGRSDIHLSIHQIMNGQGDPNQNKTLRGQMFKLPEHLKRKEDDEYVDITPDNEDT